MAGQQQSKRRIWWDRMRENAISMLERDIEELKHKTVDPQHCLADDDKKMMRERQEMMEHWQSEIGAIRKDRFYGKVLTVQGMIFTALSKVFLPPKP